MSYADYEKFTKNAPKCRFFRSTGGVSEQEIAKAENLLGIKFSNQCREFYENYGYVSFEGNEILGINTHNLEILAVNSLAMALHERKEYGLPHPWLPIYDFQDYSLACQDYSQLNSEGEPKIIVAGYTGEKYVLVETIAEDFGEFVFQLVTMQLGVQEKEGIL